VQGVGAGEQARYMGLRLTDLISSSPYMRGAAEPAPLQHVNVAIGIDQVLACVDCALYFVRDASQPMVILQGGGRDFGFGGRTIKVEVMARTGETGGRFFSEMRAIMRRRNIYRGQVISLDIGDDRAIKVLFHRLPGVRREDIILPPGVLERIERNAIRYSEHRERLLAAKRHLKRGMLFYGPPGTGKTFTAMHLAARMTERTVILLTGRAQGLLEEACQLARLLEPATVILEDVDLVAEERTHQNQCGNSLLFELLNQMDGLNQDADVLFLLTTNRPDILEPALAARPGRIDLAVEIPLPDADCRRRLLALYGVGLDLRADLERIVERTKGVSAAFIRELLRLAAVLAAEDGPAMIVTADHLDAALRELAFDSSPLGRKLLGAAADSP
jgi:hypothetical protein